MATRPPDGPRPETPRPRGAARREALLEAVLRIVAEVGPDAVTHRRVAEVAQLPLASTTYWFESKDHLLTAALELAAERDTARLLEYATEIEASDVDHLDAVVGAITECDDGSQANRGSLIATFALLLEAARRPGAAADRSALDRGLHAHPQPAAGAGRVQRPARRRRTAARRADGLLLEQLASGTTRTSARDCGGSPPHWWQRHELDHVPAALAPSRREDRSPGPRPRHDRARPRRCCSSSRRCTRR